MKMAKKGKKTIWKYNNIAITDVDGETKIFKTVKEVAEFFDVHPMYVYKILSSKAADKSLRGCHIVVK